jgi:restriction system protein
MLPVLRRCAEKNWKPSELIKRIVEDIGLSQEEREQRLKSGEFIIANRVGWAVFYLRKAKLLDHATHGIAEISQRGRDLLKEKPTTIDTKLLERYEEFRAFLKKQDSANG